MFDYLFRGRKFHGQKEWVYGQHYIETADKKHYIIADYYVIYRVFPESIGLCSSLIDRNGTKIFEGDVIEYMAPDGRYVGVVRFGRHKTTDGHEYIGFYVDWGKWPNTEYIRNDLIYWVENAGAVVIGNVTDNPELLEVKDNG